MTSPSIRTVHVIFKTHLDLGFTDTAANVKHAYMTRFIPQALALARELRTAGGPDRFVWTTGSWLVYEFLDQASGEALRQMEEGIAAGDIVWHALPFTAHSEMMDAGVFRFGLSLARELDRRFGRVTIAAKMTDIPGHTRAIVPLLAEAGVRFLHIGVNPACKAPDVPEAFIWQTPGGESILVNYSKSGYGDALSVPGLDEALVFAHTGDNNGPPPAEAVHHTFAELRAKYPGAEVRASTMDAFARRLNDFSSALPVVTDEIGDTWIHGMATDPAKTAGFRALRRWRAARAEQAFSPDEAARFKQFSRALLCIPEHTWGKDYKTWLGDYANYDRPGFEAARQADVVTAPPPAGLEYTSRWSAQIPRRTYSGMEASWTEQREYLHAAVAALGAGQLGQAAAAALDELKPARTNHHLYRAVAAGVPLVCGGFEVEIDPASGALRRLRERSGGHDWADATHLLCAFSYQTFSEADHDRYLKDYTVRMDEPWIWPWALQDLSRPGLAIAGPRSAVHGPARVEGVWHLHERDADRLLVELAMPLAAWEQAGAPRTVTIEYRFPHSEPVIDVMLQWFEKPANRMPEALWFAFHPRVAAPEAWQLDKMGQWISPLEVIRNGNRNLHAIDRGIRYRGSDGQLMIESLDAPLVAPGGPRLLHFDNRQPPLEQGMHFNLYNNIWSTNFPMWYEEDGRCRFRLRFDGNA